MAESRIPESIRQYRPGPCSEIKLIGGHYYVYMYQSQKLKSGGWGKKTGKSIGKIVPGTGFILNRNYHLFIGEESQDEITVLEYGQYALIGAITNDVIAALKDLLPGRSCRSDLRLRLYIIRERVCASRLGAGVP